MARKVTTVWFVFNKVRNERKTRCVMAPKQLRRPDAHLRNQASGVHRAGFFFSMVWSRTATVPPGTCGPRKRRVGVFGGGDCWGVLPPPAWIHHELENIDAGDDAQLPNQRELLRNHIDVGYVAHVEAEMGCRTADSARLPLIKTTKKHN